MCTPRPLEYNPSNTTTTNPQQQCTESYTSLDYCDVNNVDIFLGNIKSEFKQELSMSVDYFGDINHINEPNSNIFYHGSNIFKDQNELSFADLNKKSSKTIGIGIDTTYNATYDCCIPNKTNLSGNSNNKVTSINSDNNINTNRVDHDADVWWSSIINNINNSNKNCNNIVGNSINSSSHKNLNKKINNSSTFLNVPNCLPDFECDIDEGYVDYSSASSSGVLSPDLDFGGILSFNTTNNFNNNVDSLPNGSNSYNHKNLTIGNGKDILKVESNASIENDNTSMAISSNNFSSKAGDAFIYNDVADIKTELHCNDNNNNSDKLLPSLLIIKPSNNISASINDFASEKIKKTGNKASVTELLDQQQPTSSCSMRADFDDCGLFSLPSSPELSNYFNNITSQMSTPNAQQQFHNDTKNLEAVNFSPTINFDFDGSYNFNFSDYDNNVSEINDYLDDFERQSFNCGVKMETDLYQNNNCDNNVSTNDKFLFYPTASNGQNKPNLNDSNSFAGKRVWSTSCLMLNRSNSFSGLDLLNTSVNHANNSNSTSASITNDVTTNTDNINNGSTNSDNTSNAQKNKTPLFSGREDHVYAAKLPINKSKKRAPPKTFEQAEILCKQPNVSSTFAITKCNNIQNYDNSLNNFTMKDQKPSLTSSSILEIFLTSNKTLDPNKGSNTVLAEELKRLERLSTVRSDRLLEKLLTSDVNRWQP